MYGYMSVKKRRDNVVVMVENKMIDDVSNALVCIMLFVLIVWWRWYWGLPMMIRCCPFRSCLAHTLDLRWMQVNKVINIVWSFYFISHGIIVELWSTWSAYTATYAFAPFLLICISRNYNRISVVNIGTGMHVVALHHLRLHFTIYLYFCETLVIYILMIFKFGT